MVMEMEEWEVGFRVVMMFVFWVWCLFNGGVGFVVVVGCSFVEEWCVFGFVVGVGGFDIVGVEVGDVSFDLGIVGCVFC